MYLRILGWRRVFSLLRASLAVWTFEKNPIVEQIKNQFMEFSSARRLSKMVSEDNHSSDKEIIRNSQ